MQSPKPAEVSQETLRELSVGDYKVIYVYSTELSTHQGHLKIGEATLKTSLPIDELLEKCEEHNGLYTSEDIFKAASLRVGHQGQTIQVATKTHAAFLAVGDDRGSRFGFRDHDVHRVLSRSGFSKKDLIGKGLSEWFELDLETAIEAIRATAASKTHLGPRSSAVSIELRPEQEKAVKKALDIFTNGTLQKPKECLWNAIMRFGKTVSAYELIKQSSDIDKVLVLTHRPVVLAGWQEDFESVLGDTDYRFSARKSGATFDEVKDLEKFVYFASIQDLRGSQEAPSLTDSSDASLELPDGETGAITEAQEFLKNEDVFATKWDLVIVDEAHEGSQTTLASIMFDNVQARYKLSLSGTPFNISTHFTDEQTYSWTYEDEQRAKENWEKDHPDESNPYSSLPEIEIHTYNIEKALDTNAHYLSDGASFSFSKFFEVTPELKEGDVYSEFRPFAQESNVSALLDLISQRERGFDDDGNAQIYEVSLYPFVGENADIDFADTFWILPSIDATKALHELLAKHQYFKNFAVVNASGDNDGGRPLERVKEAIKANSKTITLSIGKLTTGTTVPEWTAVFMLSNMKSAMQYAQTAFRSKSSGTLRDGRAKEKAYVFDFDPDRTLSVTAEIADSQVSKSDSKSETEELLDQLLISEERRTLKSIIPVIIWKGASFERADSRLIMQHMKRFSASKVLESGFTDFRMFDSKKLLDLSPSIFDKMEALSKGSKSSKDIRPEDLAIAKSSLSERLEALAVEAGITLEPGASLKKVLEGSAVKNEAKEEISQAEKRRTKARDIMRAISKRLPLMILGMPERSTSEEFTPQNFAHAVDSQSWLEFMPKNLLQYKSEDGTGLSWEELSEFFDQEVFIAAVNQLEDKVKQIHTMEPLERGLHIYRLFGTFHSPDKETVLTPAKVVELQYGSTLGGLRWLNDQGFVRVESKTTGEVSFVELSVALDSGLYIAAPEFIEPPKDAENIWELKDPTILDLNSKTALYPLFAALTLYYKKIQNYPEEDRKYLTTKSLWRDIVGRSIFANTRVEYSTRIFERVMFGYEDSSQANVTTVDVIELRKAVRALESHYAKMLRKSGSKVRSREASEDFKKNKEPLLYRWVFSLPAMSQVEADKNGKTRKKSEVRAGRIMEAAYAEGGVELLESILKEAGEDEAPLIAATVGNPPYQIDSQGEANIAPSVYHHFMIVSKSIARNVSLIYPVRWMVFGSGEGIEEFKNEELKSKHYKSFFIFEDSSDLFQSVGINGGICYFSWSHEESDSVNVYDGRVWRRRSTLSDGLKVGLLRNEYFDLVKKINTEKSFETRVSPRGFYGEEVSSKTTLAKIKKTDDESVRLYYVDKGLQTAYLPSHFLKHDKTYKVFVSKAAHPKAGSYLSRPDRILLGELDDICSLSFLRVGGFNEKSESIRCMLFMKTDFFNFLMGVISVTQNTTSRNYAFIPNLDFATGEILDKPGVFLDFSKPETLDAQLAEIYGLTNEERELMSKDLKPWKSKVDVEADR